MAEPSTPGFVAARAVADTILYEGYVLYPYRASAQKNRERFQFGVLMPPAYTAVDPSEHSFSRTECLVECPDEAAVHVHVRFLHVQRRTRSDGDSWDEAAECEREFIVRAAGFAGEPAVFDFRVEEAEWQDEDDGPGAAGNTVTRRREPLAVRLTVAGERVAGPFDALKLSCLLENRTEPPACLKTKMKSRSDALPFALISAHLLLEAPGCSFLSMTDPPEWAAAHVAECRNEHIWPVLAGPADSTELLLSSPVILYDHPRLAPESPGDLYDATEIDEILTLRTLALTDAEKAEARATDPRAAALIDRVDDIPQELLDRLHGTVRYLRAVTEPETDAVTVGGVTLRKGSRVLMRPGSRRADAQDMFLAGRPAVVEAVLTDVDGQVYLAVTAQDDPAAPLHRWHGRFLYFAPDEVEPIGEAP